MNKAFRKINKQFINCHCNQVHGLSNVFLLLAPKLVVTFGIPDRYLACKHFNNYPYVLSAVPSAPHLSIYLSIYLPLCFVQLLLVMVPMKASSQLTRALSHAGRATSALRKSPSQASSWCTCFSFSATSFKRSVSCKHQCQYSAVVVLDVLPLTNVHDCHSMCYEFTILKGAASSPFWAPSKHWKWCGWFVPNNNYLNSNIFKKSLPQSTLIFTDRLS